MASERTNEDRAASAKAMLETTVEWEEGGADGLTDILTNLMHFARIEKLDFCRHLQAAQGHHADECEAERKGASDEA